MELNFWFTRSGWFSVLDDRNLLGCMHCMVACMRRKSPRRVPVSNKSSNVVLCKNKSNDPQELRDLRDNHAGNLKLGPPTVLAKAAAMVLTLDEKLAQFTP